MYSILGDSVINVICVTNNFHKTSSQPEALPVAVHPVERLDDDVVLVQVLLQLVRLGGDAALLLKMATINN